MVWIKPELAFEGRASVLVNALRNPQEITGKNHGPVAARVLQGRGLGETCLPRPDLPAIQNALLERGPSHARVDSVDVDYEAPTGDLPRMTVSA